MTGMRGFATDLLRNVSSRIAECARAERRAAKESRSDGERAALDGVLSMPKQRMRGRNIPQAGVGGGTPQARGVWEAQKLGALRRDRGLSPSRGT